MKIKLIILALICFAALSAGACTNTNKQNSISFTSDDFAQSKNQTPSITGVKIGNTITITLPSNATTGFQWALTAISDTSVLKQDGKSQYVLPESTLVGAGGQEIWTFKALNRGTSTIYMEYSQAWNGGTKGAWILAATVTVK